jgi:hypothetical protein
MVFLLIAASCSAAESVAVQVVPFRYEDAREFSDGVAAVKLKGKWGYIDASGRVAIPLSFDVAEAGCFSEGLALVGNVFIDAEGQPAFGDKRFERGRGFSEGVAAVQSKGKWGFIGHDGNFSILPVYDGAGDFSGGLAPVKRDGLWGYVDLDGRLLITPRFAMAWEFGAGSGAGKDLAPVEFDGKVGYMDRSGRFAIAPVYDFGGRFHNSLAVIREANGWSYIGPDGLPAVAKRFHAAGRFSEGLAPVATDARWGYIDVRGALVVLPLYDEARPFSEGLAAVSRDGKWGYIKAR